MTTHGEVAEIDKQFLADLRKNVRQFTEAVGQQYDGQGVRVLDVAPQVHEGAAPYFKSAQVDTLDLDPQSGATYIADLCRTNAELIKDASYDIVVCTEVLEHTLNPFAAVAEMQRILRVGGVAAVSTPFNFRIHGPLPDCWRFTEHGLRELFKDFELVSLEQLDDPDRFLMPVHYTLVAKKK
ncbi:MAG: methyltransferase domain-containing protein [Patescibacteria group bacterium]